MWRSPVFACFVCDAVGRMVFLMQKNVSCIMTAFFHLCAAWTLAPIDRVAATTTVRLWHDLHSSALQAHDFAHLLAPAPPAMTFFAAIQHDEMRACCHYSPWQVCRCPSCAPPKKHRLHRERRLRGRKCVRVFETK